MSMMDCWRTERTSSLNAAHRASRIACVHGGIADDDDACGGGDDACGGDGDDACGDDDETIEDDGGAPRGR